MPRPVLPDSRLHPAIADTVANWQADIVHNVQAAVGSHRVLVVGMAQNPFCRRARKMLDKAGIDYRYLEYGSYLRGWRERSALKMWSGWPTFPMVFFNGVLVGGADDLRRLIGIGEIERLQPA